jgi:glutamate synthase domain-containing protein 1
MATAYLSPNYQKISGVTAVNLVPKGTLTDRIQSVVLANIHASQTAVIDLYISSSTNDFYIFKGLDLPAGVTLKLENDEVSYNSAIFDLYIKLDDSNDTVDVIIR